MDLITGPAVASNYHHSLSTFKTRLATLPKPILWSCALIIHNNKMEVIIKEGFCFFISVSKNNITIHTDSRITREYISANKDNTDKQRKWPLVNQLSLIFKTAPWSGRACRVNHTTRLRRLFCRRSWITSHQVLSLHGRVRPPLHVRTAPTQWEFLQRASEVQLGLVSLLLSVLLPCGAAVTQVNTHPHTHRCTLKHTFLKAHATLFVILLSARCIKTYASAHGCISEPAWLPSRSVPPTRVPDPSCVYRKQALLMNSEAVAKRQTSV